MGTKGHSAAGELMDSDWDVARRRGDLSRLLASLCLSISADRRNGSLSAAALCSLVVGCRGRTSGTAAPSKDCKEATLVQCCWHGVWARKSCLT